MNGISGARIPQGILQEQFSNASKLLRDRVGDISGDIVYKEVEQKEPQNQHQI